MPCSTLDCSADRSPRARPHSRRLAGPPAPRARRGNPPTPIDPPPPWSTREIAMAGDHHSQASWKETLADRMNPGWAEEIDQFEAQLQLRKKGKLDEKVVAETRLRRGVYGQRYDNGKRHDGVAERALAFETKPTKGPDTLWDAPGMQR